LSRLDDPVPRLPLLGLLERGGRATLPLLQPVREPAGGGAHRLGRGAADGDLGRQRHAARSGGRRRAGGDHEERGERLHRALELRARRHLRRDRRLHAGRTGAGCGPSWAAGDGSGGAALAVERLTKSFGGLVVTASVDLAVAAGERRLIIGPNGAGKTTLFNLVTGELRPDGGTVTLFGRDITRTPGWHRAHLGISRTYQIITLFPRETLLRNVTLSLLGRSRLGWNPVARLDGQAALADRAREALARVGLEHLAERPLSQTSYGERRRVEIAMALAQDPRVLLLDEPFAGLSVEERRDVLHLVNRIPRDVTIVMIEHDMDTALD